MLLDRLGSGSPLRLAGPLTLPLLLVVLAGIAGAVTGAFAGESGKDLIFAARQLAWLPIVPLLVVNVVETERDARWALAFGGALAILKAILGLAGVAAGVGIVVEGATITYYEPTANWLVLLAILGIAAAALLRARPPAWALAGMPLLVLSLALSFRRSFWIAAALAILLVILLGSRPLGRRLAVVAGVLLALAAWTVSLQPVQTETPIVERARSLEPAKVESNAQDRYRLDELRNVTAEIRRHPVTGLGLGGEWTAIHPLGVEHENGRSYTHVVALWWWMKLGILGLIAYLAVVGTSLAMGWQVWRRSTDPLLSAAGLAMLVRPAGPGGGGDGGLVHRRRPALHGARGRRGRAAGGAAAAGGAGGVGAGRPPRSGCYKTRGYRNVGCPHSFAGRARASRSAAPRPAPPPPPGRAAPPRPRVPRGLRPARAPGRRGSPPAARSRPPRRGPAPRSPRFPATSSPVAPSAAVATTGRSTSIPIEIASGSPSVGEGQNTTTSHAGQQLRRLRPGGRDEVRRLAERRRPGAQLRLGLALADHHQVHGRPRLARQPQRGVDRHLVALLGVEAGQAPDREGLVRHPERAPPRRPDVRQRAIALGVQRVGHHPDPLARHAGRDQRAARALRHRQDRGHVARGAPVEQARAARRASAAAPGPTRPRPPAGAARPAGAAPAAAPS